MDSIGAYLKSKVDGGGNDDVANTPKKKMNKAKKDIESLISKGLCALYPRKGGSILQQQKEGEGD